MASTREIASFVDHLLEGFGKTPFQDRELRERTSFYSADVEFAIERLNVQVFTFEAEETGFPCIVDRDGPLPLLLSSDFLRPSARFEEQDSSSYPPVFYELAEFYRNREIRFASVPVQVLERALRDRITRFLRTRVGEDDEAPRPTARAVGAAPHGFLKGSPYLSFQVSTPGRSGLRIHYTPSYFVDWNNVFGSPTTPVDGWILPGRYKFGAMTPNGDFLIDNANFDIPPLTSAELVLR